MGDSERGRFVVENAEWHRHDDGRDRYAMLVIRVPYDADLSCVATREAALDAAIAAKQPHPKGKE